MPRCVRVVSDGLAGPYGSRRGEAPRGGASSGYHCAAMPIQNPHAALFARIHADSTRMEADLAAWVAMDTHSANKQGVDALGALLCTRLEAMGFRVAELVNGVHGRTLVARRGPRPTDVSGGDDGPRNAATHPMLLLGHMDTVHPASAGFNSLQRVEGSTHAKGAGAADMKGGLVVLLHALEALHAEGLLDRRALRVVLNGDEEVGSPASGELIRAEAADCGLCLCFEAGRVADGGSTFVTRRKGMMRLSVRARGRSAHAGVEPSLGASAVRELAGKVGPIEDLADAATGTTVLVGTFHGGTAANTVPEEATLDIDVRFDDDDVRQQVEDDLQGILRKPVVRDAAGRPRVATTIRERVFRPPMEANAVSEGLAAELVRLAAEHGQVLVPEARGGSSDAALAADVGCPALCGLGAVGGAFHTRDEWVDLASLPQRTALLARLILDLGLVPEPRK